MTIDLAAALADADQLQAGKRATPTRRPALVGVGPDRPMPYIAAIPAGDLFVDQAYQRPLEQARVRRMVRDWDPTMLGVLDVSDRGPDAHPRYAIVNGQHRHATAVRADPRGRDVPLVCNVHRGLAVADEAALMYRLDATTTKLNGWAKWTARRAARDPMVEAVERVAARHGLRVTAGLHAGSMQSYGAAEKLLRVGGEDLLDATLTVLAGAWGTDSAAYQAPLVTGVGTVLQRHGDAVDADRLVAVLARTQPATLRAAAAGLREIRRAPLAQLVADVLVERYNRTPGRRLAA